jgi:MYXO-CTERM domain-containing protein
VDVDGGSDTGVGEEDAGTDTRVGSDGQVILDTGAGGSADTAVASPDTRWGRDTISGGQADTADTVTPKIDALSPTDTQIATGGDADAQSDGSALATDALVVTDATAVDGSVVRIDTGMGDTGRDSVGQVASPDAVVVAPDARSADALLADSAGSGGGKGNSGCDCSLSSRGSQTGGGLALLMIGLALAARRRPGSRRRP